MASDIIADMLTRVRNAQRAGHRTVKVRSSKVSRDILDILRKEGFVESYDKCELPGSRFGGIEVVLKYYGPHEPVISQARRISTSGRRVYVRSADIPRVSRGLGICVLSTSQGVMSDRQARKLNIGGELLARVA